VTTAFDIDFYTAATPNGWKVAIVLEELGLRYRTRKIDFEKGEQREPWFTDLNPNGRIPVIADHRNGGFVLAESGAILWYLAESAHRLLPTQPSARYQALQWLMFQMSGVGPMMGQASYFQRVLEPQGLRHDFAIARYVGESRRLLEVLDQRLAGREYVVGDDYSIADIALYPWVRTYPWAKVSIDGLNNLTRWFSTLEARPAVRRGCAVPEPFPAAFGRGSEAEAVRLNVARFGASPPTGTGEGASQAHKTPGQTPA
jgi:GST-like protein